MEAALSQRSTAVEKLNKADEITFQAISWHAADVDFADIDGPDGEGADQCQYIIKIFGVSDEDKTVSVSVRGFTPFFYIKMQDRWTERDAQLIKDFALNKIPRVLHGHVRSTQVFEKKDLWGFTNFRNFRFLRFCFTSLKAMRKVQYALENFGKTCNVPGIGNHKFTLYECNIDPYIRFMHVNNLEPSGWITIKGGNYRDKTDILPTTSQIDIEASWKKVEPCENDVNARFLVSSFDIECMSETGDFPVPKKDYKKLAADTLDAFEALTKDPAVMVGCRVDVVVACILSAFGIATQHASLYPKYVGMIHPVFPKRKSDPSHITKQVQTYIDEFMVLLNRKLDGECKRTEVLEGLGKRLSSRDMGLPALHGDAIIQIGTTFHFYGEKECCHRHILTLKSCDPIEGVEVHSYDSEAGLLLAWRDMVQKYNPDVMTGYNIFGFDMLYMRDRAMELGIHDEFMKTSRFQGAVCQFKEVRLSSSALGDNELKFIDMEGRVLIDMMKVVQRDYKLDSFKLDNVAHHFLKKNKNDVSPNDIFRLQREGAAERKIIAEYCVQDCALCNYLIMKLEILANNMGMSNVCLVPLSFIFMRGQGVKIFSLVLKQCKDDGFVIPVIRPPRTPFGEPPPVLDEEEGYEGAIVLEPKTGIYLDAPITVLDYASLYPSSMISGNLSPDCIVTDPKYDNLPGVEYLDVAYDIYEGLGDKKHCVGEKVCRFAQLPNEEKGVIPRILSKLLKARKTTRKKIEWQLLKTNDGREFKGFVDDIDDSYKVTCVDEDEGKVVTLPKHEVESVGDCYNEFQKAVLDGLQNAYKVTANSLYGQVGARTSPIYMKDIAACTTATGRMMIMKAKKFVEDNYEGAHIVYGDSVAGYTPITYKFNGLVGIDTVENIAKRYGHGKWLPVLEPGKQDKEGCELLGLDVWTDDGWTPACRLIRHALAPHKRMLRVLTHTGVVDVTDDHSLIRANGEKVTPKDLKIGDTLLHTDTPEFAVDDTMGITIHEARSAGFFMGADRSQSTIVPQEILCAADNVKLEFWRGLCDADGQQDHTNQLSASTIYALATSLGYNVAIDYQAGVYQLTVVEDNIIKQDQDAVRKIMEIPYTGYVYDFTTGNHKFQAGVGRIVASNTDSIFVQFDTKDQQGNQLQGEEARIKAWNTAKEVSHEFKKTLKRPHDLEVDKLFHPFVLLSKKRYVGNKYEGDMGKSKQMSMGIVLKRRDNANIVKKVYGGIIDIILNKQDIDASMEFLKTELESLIDGKTGLDDLIITKSLRADYKNPEGIAHKVLVERIGERDPGNKPQVNDRIPFVYVEQPPPPPGVPKYKHKILQGERIEHPDYIKANNLRPDYAFYITNQIMKPVTQIYAIVAEKLGLRTPAEYDALHEEYLAAADGNVDKAHDKLVALKEKDVKKHLFDAYLERIERMRLPEGAEYPVKKTRAPAKKKQAALYDSEGIEVPGDIIPKAARAPRAKKAVPVSATEPGAGLVELVEPLAKKPRAPRKPKVTVEVSGEPGENADAVKKPRAPRKPKVEVVVDAHESNAEIQAEPVTKKPRAPRKPKPVSEESAVNTKTIANIPLVIDGICIPPDDVPTKKPRAVKKKST